MVLAHKSHWPPFQKDNLARHSLRHHPMGNIWPMQLWTPRGGSASIPLSWLVMVNRAHSFLRRQMDPHPHFRRMGSGWHTSQLKAAGMRYISLHFPRVERNIKCRRMVARDRAGATMAKRYSIVRT